MNFCEGILSETQTQLLPALAKLPEHFILYGGTALALRLGHRASVDFDFFSFSRMDASHMLQELPFAARPIQVAENTLTVVSDNGVKVSFFSSMTSRRIASDDDYSGIKVASLIDIFAAKLKCVFARSEPKDYIDIDALLRSGLTLAEGVAAAKAAYGSTFNEMLPLKALTYFEEESLKCLPAEVKQRLVEAVCNYRKGLEPVYFEPSPIQKKSPKRGFRL